jgi:hypothetical protein
VLDQNCIKGFISEDIRGLISIFHGWGVKDKSTWHLFYDIILLDPVTVRHVSQFQIMRPQHRSRGFPLREWW